MPFEDKRVMSAAFAVIGLQLLEISSLQGFVLEGFFLVESL
jgi:hypothetical protein